MTKGKKKGEKKYKIGTYTRTWFDKKEGKIKIESTKVNEAKGYAPYYQNFRKELT